MRCSPSTSGRSPSSSPRRSPRRRVVEMLDVIFGLVILVDLGARIAIADRRWSLPRAADDTRRHRSRWSRSWRRSPARGWASCGSCERSGCCTPTSCWSGCGRTSAFFRRNEEVVVAAINLVVFLFVMTGLIYATQYRTNPEIAKLRRRALLHRDDADDDRVRRHHARRDVGPDDVGRGDDLRRDAVPAPGAGAVPTAQGASRMPGLRPAAARSDAMHCKHCGTTIHIETEGAV